MALALLCSGQGNQHANMFAMTGDVPSAQPLFSHTRTLLGGRDPRELVRTASSDALHRDRAGQVLCTLQALAAAAALRDCLPDRIVVAGYSVGEVAAWGVAGLFDPVDTLDLVARRTEIMDAISPAGDGMLFVRGLSRNAIDCLCTRHGAAIAIVNPGDAFVIGGSRPSLDALGREAKAMYASRVVDVPVEVASHTPRLAKASRVFRAALGEVAVAFPPCPGMRVLSGIDAAPVLDSATGLDKLAAQLSHTVQWADCLESCGEAGARHFLELGPGSALSRMADDAVDGIMPRCLEDFRTLQGVREWLAHRTQH